MAEADLGLGCGLPTEHAGLAPGQTVVDLGSGAGNDVFIARSVVGDTGRVIGVDMTTEMIDKARANAERRGFKNVEFRLGDIESLPVDDAAADIVVSNCVLNLVPDKRLAFAEIFRVLKPGGRFCVSDIVIQGELPAELRGVAELYVGCVAGALAAEEYIGIIHETGFTGIDIKAVKRLDLPDEYMLKYIGAGKLAAYRASGAAVLSVTVVGARPSS
jgi:ubiquinone/menaquinone biosynthesis C-methylase UbiE